MADSTADKPDIRVGVDCPTGENVDWKREWFKLAAARNRDVSILLASAIPPRRMTGDALYASFGYALAVRVLQGPLYESLDDRERAECDALVRGEAPVSARATLIAEARLLIRDAQPLVESKYPEWLQWCLDARAWCAKVDASVDGTAKEKS